MSVQSALPSSMSELCNVFQVSQLSKYSLGLFQPMELETITLKSVLTYQLEPFYMDDRDVKSLSIDGIPKVKFEWEKSDSGEFHSGTKSQK